MPYERSPQVLDELIDEVLRNEEIQRGVEQARVEDESLKSHLRERASSIWAAASTEIEAFNRAEDILARKARELEQLKKEGGIRQDSSGISASLKRGLVVLAIIATIAAFLSTALGLTGPTNSSRVEIIVALAGILVLVGCGIAWLRFEAAQQPGRQAALLPEAQKLEQELAALRERLQSARQAIPKAVIEKGMLPELRSLINARLAPSYDTDLTIISAPGLAEVFNPEYEITTEPKDRLHRLLDNMPGGSIGVAGPRGAGKTTLLGAFCRKESINQLKGRQVLSVITSAPVEYDAREFILHIFSSVCQRTLELKGRATRSHWENLEDVQRPPSTLFVTVVGLRETLAFVGAGMVLIGLSLYLDASLLGISQGFVSGLGLSFAALGVLGLWMQAVYMYRGGGDTRRDSAPETGDPLVMEANRWLREIRFQQTYYSGWGGSLKVPIAQATAEAKADTSVTLARHQLSLPEIMDAYREFVGMVSQEYEIIIGIDELDKIGSDEQAQRFLNEIKALFGLESCFYLVSVSESALSSFERRGLPLRDVFDSSFDAIIHVDYLNLDRAQQLLRRRVIGVPVPFLDFCHCMAGGLPRDLIRAFRELFEERRQANNGGNTLSTLCSALIRADVKSKLRAASIEAKNVASEPEANELFSNIYDLEASLEGLDGLPNGAGNLLASQRRLLDTVRQKEPAKQTEQSVATPNRERMTALTTELGIYLYYCATLLEFFGEEDFDVERLKRAESSGAFDQLSRARQSFAISPSIAESAITKFRKQYSMSIQ